MTFTEAALEVLRSVGKPLHYKKITEIAIERSLLSHVGKSPELTMSSRLATMVKVYRGNSPIMKVRPGVFAMRDWNEKKNEAQDAQGEPEEASPPDQPDASSAPTGDADEAGSAGSSQPLPGADIFPAEEDDDEPILAGLEREDDDQSEDARNRRRRKRRRRTKADGEAEPGSAQGSARERNGPYGQSTDHGPRRRSYSEGPYHDRGRYAPDGELLGKDLADAVRAVLLRSDRRLLTLTKTAELLVGRGRLAGTAAALAPTVAAAVRADISRAELGGSRPRFRLKGNLIGLTEWQASRDAIRAEEAVAMAAERQREQTRRSLIQKLNELSTAGFAEIIATWLNAEGVVALRAIRRPGAGSGQLHFAGTLKRGVEESRLAIVVLRDGRSIDRETVVAIRGALHHYGKATAAWLVTTGRVAGGAWEETHAEGAAPCALFDGFALAEAMERLGVGCRRYQVVVTGLDHDLFEALLDRSETRARDEGDRGRERGRRSRRSRPSEAPPEGEADAEVEEEPTAAERGSRASRQSERPPRRGKSEPPLEAVSEQAVSDSGEAPEGDRPDAEAADAGTQPAEEQSDAYSQDVQDHIDEIAYEQSTSIFPPPPDALSGQEEGSIPEEGQTAAGEEQAEGSVPVSGPPDEPESGSTAGAWSTAEEDKAQE